MLRVTAAGPTPEEEPDSWVEPTLQSWHAPKYPADLIKDGSVHRVAVRFIIGTSGEVESARVTDDSGPPFSEYAINTVTKWTFSPALEKGKPVQCCMDVAVIFNPANRRREGPPDKPNPEENPLVCDTIPASAKATPNGDYPEVMRDRWLPGIARFEGTVTKEGTLVRPRIVVATHTEFVLAALRALAGWQFTPRMQGDLPLEAPISGEVSFSVLDDKVSAEDVLKDNGFTVADAGGALVALPTPVLAVDAVWPFDMLVKGEGGSAVVDCQVSATGVVTDARVREASSPAVGAALLAAVTGWSFDPARADQGAVKVGLTKRAGFLPIPPEPDEELKANPTVRLVLAIRRGAVGTAKGLDQKLEPIYRVAPQYPLALKGEGAPAGKAEIEFVIDREGRVRLPRIVSASQEEFGWAAATAMAQWVFEPPMRHGEAVDVKVRIPFDFKAPAS